MATCQVVPNVASYSVDDGFRYRIPDGVHVEVGHRVRIRLGGRRVRGFVTEVFDHAPDRDLVDIDGIVGTVPSFDTDGLRVLRWCAAHYVAPLAVVLNRTVPPNVPRTRRPSAPPRTGPSPGPGLRSIVSSAPHGSTVAELVARRPDGSAMIVAPSLVEAEEIAAELRRDRDGEGTPAVEPLLAHSGLAAKDTTAAWVAAATGTDVVLVGTREIALWPVPDLGSIIVVEDARRVMRSPSTPTIGVREVMMRRAGDRRIPMSMVAPVPSLEVLRTRPTIVAPPGRQWPLVEVADRNEEPPGASVLLDRSRQAIAGAARRGPVFVLVPRRGYAAAFRCSRCGTVRRCDACGSAVSGSVVCLRCGAAARSCRTCGADSWRPLGAGIGVVVDDLRRTLGDRVSGPSPGATVTVGTERDLVGRAGLSLAVAIDADGLALAPNYLAGEHALRTLVRLAHTVGRGPARRALVQTSDPDQPVLRALVSGRSDDFLAEELGRRRAAAFPPFSELIAVEVADVDPDAIDLAGELGAAAMVRGPAVERDRVRWLISGADLTEARTRLRSIVGVWRDRGARVRVDVDPIDL